MRLDEFRELYEAYRRHHRIASRATPSRVDDVYDRLVLVRGLRVETATREPLDPEHGGEATCAWRASASF